MKNNWKFPKIFLIMLFIVLSTAFFYNYQSFFSDNEKIQCETLSNEIQQLNLKSKFMPIYEAKDIFFKQGHASYISHYYFDGSRNEVLDNCIEYFSKYGWHLRDKIDKYQCVFGKEKILVYITIEKGKIYGYENYPDKFLSVRYSYRDGWFEK